MEAIIYVRVSKNSQDYRRQINELKEIKSFHIAKVFKDSESAFLKPMDERTGLKNAIQYALQNKIHTILVSEISRLGRKTEEVLSLISYLKKKQIKIYIASLGITINEDNATDSINKFAITLLVDIARMESEQLSIRIRSGIEERKRRGLHTGRLYGSTESREKFLHKHKKAIKHLNNGRTVREISNILKLSPTTVQKVRNVYYQQV